MFSWWLWWWLTERFLVGDKALKRDRKMDETTSTHIFYMASLWFRRVRCEVTLCAVISRYYVFIRFPKFPLKSCCKVEGGKSFLSPTCRPVMLMPWSKWEWTCDNVQTDFGFSGTFEHNKILWNFWNYANEMTKMILRLLHSPLSSLKVFIFIFIKYYGKWFSGFCLSIKHFRKCY